MYFRDLSAYEYGVPGPVPGVRNVGWLDAGHEFERGRVPGVIVERLRWLGTERRVAQRRGYHWCPFCRPRELDRTRPEFESGLSSAEIWVPDEEDGGYFAAPVLIVHYIAGHDYAPPDVFVRAVERLVIGAHMRDLDAESTKFIRERLSSQ